MKAKQLPSGAWRCRVYMGKDENGKKIYKSVTDPDRRHCEAIAATYGDHYRDYTSRKTLSEAMDEYLTLQKAVLSPKTFKEYKGYKARLDEQYEGLSALQCHAITSKHIQMFVNQMVRQGRSTKTIKNYCGFISVSLREQDIQMPRYNLPKEIEEEPYIPSSEEVKQIIELAKAEEPELVVPIMLAAFASMRRSEICALRYPEDFRGNTITINKDMVQNEDNDWVIKTTKNRYSTRRVELPSFVVDLIKEQGYVTKMLPSHVTNQFTRLIRKAKLPKFSFHKLRHYSASIALGMGIPLTIVESRGGWEPGSGALSKIYTHVLEEQRSVETEKINAFFTENF